MKKVFVAHVTTNDGDHRHYVFKSKPTLRAVAKRVWEDNGKTDSLKSYEEGCSIDIKECEVE